MIDILIVTHGSFGDGLKETAKLIVGDVSRITVIGFNHGEDPGELEGKIISKINNSVDIGNKILIFTDLLGGTPSNRIAIYLNTIKNLDEMESITGINLPMLLEALMLTDSEKTLIEVKECCLKTGTDGIKDLKKIYDL